jgi:DNA-binding NarL/FixJ family response regulator
VRVVIGEDEALLREGLVLLLSRAGFEVLAAEDDADRLVSAALQHRPDVVVTDIRMPPDSTDDGLRAALKVRSRLPRTAVVVLSHHLSRQYALDLLATGPAGVGYLLKQRVADARRFTATCGTSPPVARRSTRRSRRLRWHGPSRSTTACPGSPAASARSCHCSRRA